MLVKKSRNANSLNESPSVKDVQLLWQRAVFSRSNSLKWHRKNQWSRCVWWWKGVFTRYVLQASQSYYPIIVFCDPSSYHGSHFCKYLDPNLVSWKDHVKLVTATGNLGLCLLRLMTTRSSRSLLALLLLPKRERARFQSRNLCMKCDHIDKAKKVWRDMDKRKRACAQPN